VIIPNLFRTKLKWRTISWESKKVRSVKVSELLEVAGIKRPIQYEMQERPKGSIVRSVTMKPRPMWNQGGGVRKTKDQGCYPGGWKWPTGKKVGGRKWRGSTEIV